MTDLIESLKGVLEGIQLHDVSTYIPARPN